MVGAQGTEVGPIIVAHLPGLTSPWLGEVTSQEQHQPDASRIRSQKSDIKSEGNIVAGSGHRGGGSDHCSTPTTARLTCLSWLGEGALQERPLPDAKSPTPSQNSDINLVENGHGGGSNCCSQPTRADAPLDTPPVATEEVLAEEVLLQEQPKPTVKPSTPPSQNSHLNPEGNAGGSSKHGGGSDRCSTPTMADMSRCYGEVMSQGQPRPAPVSRIRSLQRGDTNSRGNVGGNSGHRGEGNLYNTPTRADASRWQDRSQPAAVSRIRSSQKSVVNSGGDAGGSSEHRGGSDRSSTPSTRADTLPRLGEEALQEQARTVTESPIPSSQKGSLYSAFPADGSRGGSDRRSTPTKADMPPVLGCGKVTLQEQPRPVVESPKPSSQKSHLYSAGDAGGSRGRDDRGDTPTKADIPPLAAQK